MIEPTIIQLVETAGTHSSIGFHGSLLGRAELAARESDKS
jgi:hypothetical protein